MNNPNNPILKHFENIAKSISGRVPVMIECGACDGADTQDMLGILKKYHKDVRYYAFELDQRLKDRLTNKASGATVVMKAVGNVDGVVPVNLSQGEYYGSSTIRKPMAQARIWPNMKFEGGTVECCKLDTFCTENNIDSVDILYTDVEGAEHDLIRGATEILKKTHFFHTEYMGTMYEGESITAESIAALLGKDWRVFEDFGGDVLYINDRWVM